MSGSRDYFKAIHGKTFEQWTKTARIPSVDESINRLFQKKHSRYPLRELGVGTESLLISEEEREVNFHILGAPGEGKSKFIEDQIRKDIDLGNGLCLLDPSEGGDTCHKVLRYCAKIGHQRVVLIDPDTLTKYGKIACLQPLKSKYVKQSVEGVMETISILFGVKDTNTPRIRRYLRALLRRLAENNLTLHETQDFSEYFDIKTHPIIGSDKDSQTLKNVFRSPYTFENYFLSSVGRLDVFWEEPLSLMLGADTGIDFVKMVKEGWVILVNMSPYRLAETEAELLGILVISQLIQAVDILRNNEWKGVYYLYMDEAARFATRQIDNLLSYKRKSGLRLILAHHYFEQFKDKQVLNSIMNNARIKMMFNTPDYDDRMQMVKALGYGGDIPPLIASFANQDLPKQYAIIKKNKQSPVRIRIPDVPDITEKEVSKDKLDSYIKSLLKQPWYLTKEQINQQINQRINDTARPSRDNTQSAKPRTALDSKSDSKPRISKRDNPDEEWKKVF